MKHSLFGALICCAVACGAHAQVVNADSARCAAALNARVPDSVIVEEDALVFAFDTTRKLPTSYAEWFGQGLRQMLVLPRPLVIDSYNGRAGHTKRDAGSKEYAAVALRSFYRLTLHRDGHLTSARVVGGVRNERFDRAVVAALIALDSSGMLPPPLGFDHAFAGDTLELRMTITDGSVTSTRFSGSQSPPQPGVTPLFRLRVTILQVDKPVAAQVGNPHPRYPLDLRDRGVEGEVRMEFLVRPDGTVDPASMQVQSATVLDFANAVVSVVPSMHFFPLEVAGCKVASLIQMPFVFGLNR